MNSRPTVWVLGLLLSMLTLATFVTSSPKVGIPRDEAIYFEASRRHGAWLAQLMSRPSEALSRKSRDRHFRFNREHPPLMKSLAGASARLLARPPQRNSEEKPHEFAAEGGLVPVMSESASMRLPAQVLASLAVCLLFIAGVGQARKTRADETPPLLALSGGLLAAGAFILLPRVAFHASLHCFDVPIAVATLAVVLAYRRGRSSLRWSLITGLLLGLAISIKLNAFFIGPLLALHHYASLWMRRRRGATIHRALLVPPVLVLSTIVAPLVFWVLWPWLWSQPVDRLLEYLEFHARHSYYNMEFLGANYNRPPMPIAYPWLMTWATVPSTLLLLATLGLLFSPSPRAPSEARGPGSGSRFLSRLRSGLIQDEDGAHDRGLFAIFALFPLLLISLPSIPIFGGTKHWLTAYPFMALLAASAWVHLWEHLRLDTKQRVSTFGPVLGLSLVLGPTAWATLHGHPHNLSQYAPLVGGARGAAQLGLNRGFWGYDALELITSHAEERGRVYLHDLHRLAELQYRREGRWPEGWRTSSAQQAELGLLFHERHMLSDELQYWRGDRPALPSDHVLLDDVPLTTWYGGP